MEEGSLCQSPLWATPLSKRALTSRPIPSPLPSFPTTVSTTTTTTATASSHATRGGAGIRCIIRHRRLRMGGMGRRAPFKNPGISRCRVWQIGTISFLLPPVPNWIETFSRAASASALSPFCFTDLMWGRRQRDDGERGGGERSSFANAPCRDLFEFSSPRDILIPPKGPPLFSPPSVVQ